MCFYLHLDDFDDKKNRGLVVPKIIEFEVKHQP